MLTAIPAYLAISDGGFAGAACREMSMRSGRGDREGALSLFQSTWFLLIFVSLVVGSLALLTLNFAPLHAWLGFNAMTPGMARVVMLLLVLHVLLVFQSDLLYGGYWCEGHYGMGMTLLATAQLIEFCGMALAVALGGGPAEAAAGYLGGRIAGLLLMRIGLKRATPWLRYGWRLAKANEVRVIASPAFASLAFPLGNAFNMQGTRLIVGLVLGPSAVVVFSTLRTLSRFAIQPSGIINRLVEPEMASAHGGGSQDIFRRLFIRSCQTSIWLTAISCFALCIAGTWVLGLWTHGKVAMDWPLYVLLLISAAVNAIWYTALMAAYSTNRHIQVALIYFMTFGALAFLLSFLLTAMMELPGAGVAVLMSELLIAPYVLAKTINMAGETWSSWLSHVVRPPYFLMQCVKNIIVA